jgi:hypothetical protein
MADDGKDLVAEGGRPGRKLPAPSQPRPFEIDLVYVPAIGEGPEAKFLQGAGFAVIPGNSWPCRNRSFAIHLLKRYPQIQGFGADHDRAEKLREVN